MRFKIFWILLVFILFILSKQGYGEDKTKDFTKPEEVVKQFIINRANISNFIDNNPNYCKDVVKFILNGEKYLDQVLGAGLDILGNFSILDVSIKGNTAKVKVKLKFCGGLSGDLSGGPAKWTEIVVYNLVKVDNTWKIVWDSPPDEPPFPCDDWISVPKAIKLYEYILQHYNEYKYLGPKKKLIKDMKKIKKCAKE
ncbi:hypothetical protein SULYE_0002 [Sulfurihydrogenibium yellowstonense SS-5]|jgi:hypothetical protein|uniref:Uncharacterized protein n=2 Tax=Sulfurihydrogenibium yellowstonense TaxID=304736 RepID=C4FHH4_9AQUI|nr:hypothetical protein SULYE_0002 [Sulfurihydrogenibium yellowstonense SS-5]